MTFLHPREWMETRPEGLYCKPADVFIDAHKPVPRVIVTHGHADHARPGNQWVYATPATLDIMQLRYTDSAWHRSVALDYHQPLCLNPQCSPKQQVTLTFYPAGHILGSAQALLQYAGSRLLISGDYKRRPDPTCAPFEVTPADVFITEATFGLPVFEHPPIENEIAKLINSLALFPDRCHLVGVYALGKCQRVILALRQLGYDKPIYLHGALVKMCELYAKHGIELGGLIAVNDVENTQSLAGEIVLAPPSALNDRWSRKLPNVLTAMASGWMQIRARSKQRNAELPLIISDHCDWPELLQTIEQINAPEVWVTHGREQALVYQAQKMGYSAQALSLIGYEDEDSD
ncbi:ligase-associated DNA damage response exonuclease [Alteromonas oceanisediminis]|uniref:ligase-associated DNA damage response exonuclease n=1 Tax=Alteromonas oceanisediminis TaxID=2836180 RepID=UPI001BD9F5D7|nr:ligase-associated DNA damage response exonuclease [Alteromonas oceanisediminis]MBT0586961.1 ligase-associated DNA damage response exonuclease [Alteromonas oceanisediminis]